MTPSSRPEELALALVLPLQGPAGIYGPSCQVSAQLAIEELNAASGINGRYVRAVEVDGGAAPHRVAAELNALAGAGSIDAIVGWHISAVRQAIVKQLGGRLPYVYTALYEGGERSPGVFVTGETPDNQLLPAMSWLQRELGVRRWAIVGNDYVWPRVTSRAAHAYARRLGGSIEVESYVRLGTTQFTASLDRLERAEPDAVLMLLVGQDMVHFNRQFAARGLDRGTLRFSTIIDENALLGIGATKGLYAAAGFFGSLPTADSLDFVGRIGERFGPYAPACTSVGESCYEGVRLLAHLLESQRYVDEPVRAPATLDYNSPRGGVRLAQNHLRQPVYLATADGLDFDVTAQIATVDV